MNERISIMVPPTIHDALLSYSMELEKEAERSLTFSDAIATLLANAGYCVDTKLPVRRVGRPPKFQNRY